MKNIFWSLITSVLFFLLATATSYDDDSFEVFLPTISMEAELQDSFLLLTNTDTLRMENAGMRLHRIVNDSISGDSVGIRVYQRTGYAISSGVSDTLVFSTFKSIEDQEPFPNEESPIYFSFDFFNNDGTAGFFEKEF